jgi:glucose/mannose-6-phosphate isomerase
MTPRPKLTAEEIKQYDCQGMLERILNLPQQMAHALEISRAVSLKFPADFSNVCIAGMGGSAIGGDIARAVLADAAGVPIAVSRYYSLPKYVNETSLVIACSYSGETEETLAAYDDARAKGAQIVCVTAGGSLAQKARANGHPVILIPGGYPPRAALGYLMTPLFYVLFYAGIAANPEADFRETIEMLKSLADEYNPNATPNRAQEIAYQLQGTIPLIYTAAGLAPAARRWKCQLSENSEVMAFCNLFPELNHNEIMGWGPLQGINRQFRIIYLRDHNLHPNVLKRMEITKTILEQHSGGVIEVESQGSSLLARLFALIFLGDLVSLYLAILNRVDPTAIGHIDFIKKALSAPDK